MQRYIADKICIGWGVLFFHEIYFHRIHNFIRQSQWELNISTNKSPVHVIAHIKHWTKKKQM